MYFGNLPEEFLFILIDAETQSYGIKNNHVIELGLAGATLIELIVQGRITTDSNRIRIIETNPVDDKIINHIFSRMKDENSRTSIFYWIREISTRYNLKEEFQERLISKNLIRIEQEKRYIIFTTEKYYITRPDFEKIIVQHIKDLLDETEESNVRALGFLSLIYATGATGQIFSDDEIEENLVKIRSLVENEEVGKSISDSIQIIIDALMRSQILSYTSSPIL